jgi:hypothetical protein
MKRDEFPKYRDIVSLIPGGTIQFLDIGLNIKVIPKGKTEYWEWQSDNNDQLLSKWNLMCLRPDENNGDYIDLATGNIAIDPRINSDGKPVTPSYSTSLDKAIEPYVNTWVPLPFFRREVMAGSMKQRFRKGPGNWVRAMVSEISDPESRFSHRLTLAFDTSVENSDIDNDDEPYAAIFLRDVRDGGEFALVADVSQNAWFISQDWISDWLKDLFIESLAKKRPGKKIREEDFENQVEHLARYISFIELLHNSNVIPSIRLIDPERNDAIDVDLVLDIGNSRTTGMLIERRAEQSMGLSNSSVLELRDLSNPALRHRDPFGSNIAFVKTRFGDPHGHAKGSGRRRGAFQWPSVVRIGSEAARLALRSRRDQGQTTMSSPKRYLWDQTKRNQEWRYCPETDDPTAEEPPVNSGILIGFVNNYGTPLHAMDDSRLMRDPIFKDQDSFPTTEPMFSRSSIMLFLLCEILSHALVQINSPEQRGQKQNPDIPRKLRNVMITVPPAMTIAERQIFERWTNWAVETLWRALDWSSDSKAVANFKYQSKPVVRCQWDEASTTQMVYIYNEIAEKYAGDATSYFSVFGKIRRDRGDRNSFRVASIDIGGGTTDLIVTTYVDKSQGATALLEPIQEFREGFSLAGDDILKAVIERHVLAPLEVELRAKGFANAEDFLTRRLRIDFAGLAEREKSLRSQFAQQYAIPMGLAILRKSEQTPLIEASGEMFDLKFDEVFSTTEPPRAGVLRYIDEEIEQQGIHDFSLSKWTNNVNLAEVALTIDSVVSPVLADLCEAVAAWTCDVLILSGRPSCLPAVKAVVNRRPPLLASRIVAMNSYKVEGWYPFWSPGGVIADPKTTGVVGAMLCALSEGDLLNFHCNTSKLKPASTVRYVGEMQTTGQIRNANLFFAGIDLDATAADEKQASFKFGAPMFIGFRQLPLERWKATPYYFLSFANQQAKENARTKGLPYTVTLTYRRNQISLGPNSEDQEFFDEGIFKIEEIIAADGSNVRSSDLILELKTLKDELGHWVDTGLFDRQ